MGIRPEDLLVNFIAADGNYPEGSFKNSSTPTATDGSELIKEWVNDIFGFFQKLIDIAGITPSGAADTVPVSDYFKSLSNMIGVGSFAVDSGGVNAYVINVVLTTVNSATTLTLLAGTKYFFKAVNTNTGASTLNPNGLGVTDIKRPDGSELRANDILVNEFVSVVFDGTDFILTSLQPRFSIRDISRNLIIENNTGNPLFQMDIDADEVLLQDSTGNPSRETGVNLTVDITVSGANGLDTGVEASSTWYFLWVISNGITTAGLLSLSSSAPTMPTGYTFKALVGAVFNDSGNNFVSLSQKGNRVVIAPVIVLLNGTQSSYTLVDLSSIIPLTAKTVSGWIELRIGPSSDGDSQLAATSAGFGEFNFQSRNDDAGARSFGWGFRINNLVESQTLYYKTSNQLDINLTGWEY